MLQNILDYYDDEQFLKMDGFDDCVIGVESSNMILIYSVRLCLEKLISEGMSYEDAIEYFDFNIRGAYVGEKTPILCDDCFEQ